MVKDTYRPSTPINVQSSEAELSSRPDSVNADHLLSGLSQGFRVRVHTSATATAVAKKSLQLKI